MRYLGIWQEARDFSGRSLANKKLTPLVLSTLGVKGQKILRIVPDFDHHLTTTEIFSNTQICISIPVHFAFFNVIIGKRKPPKEQSLWRFWCARLDSNQRSRLPARSVLNGPRRGPRPYRVVVIRSSKKKTGFMRVSGTSHKISSYLQKLWKPLQRLGSHGFSSFGKIVAKQ